MIHTTVNGEGKFRTVTASDCGMLYAALRGELSWHNWGQQIPWRIDRDHRRVLKLGTCVRALEHEDHEDRFAKLPAKMFYKGLPIYPDLMMIGIWRHLLTTVFASKR